MKYETGQKYNVHHDYGRDDVSLACGPRILTFFLYLSVVEEGGETAFPSLGIAIKPKKGKALWWVSSYCSSKLDGMVIFFKIHYFMHYLARLGEKLMTHTIVVKIIIIIYNYLMKFICMLCDFDSKPSTLSDFPEDQDSRTFHEAKPVIKGLKYAANSWIHMYDYEKPNLW